jgi:argininosuccinate lyase
VAGLDFQHERLAAACADPLLRAADAAEALVRQGMPFRDAHEQIAAEVRESSFEPPDDLAGRHTPGPADVRTAVAEARTRLSTSAPPLDH